MAEPPRAPERPSMWAVLLLAVSIVCLAGLVALVWFGL